MNTLLELVKKNHLWVCLDCGKCGATCPVSRWETRRHTSPRTLIEKSLHRGIDAVMDEPLFWSCLTCRRCSETCPSSVHFSEFICEARDLARQDYRSGDCTHSEMIQTWSRMMANPDMRQNRLGWLSDDLEVSDDSDTLFFVGCIPYYDPMFRKLGVETIEIARSAVRILNYLGVKPQVMPDERCCGHDQFWEGDRETFQALAALNLERIKATGAKRIVTTCPECTRTLRVDYPLHAGPHGLEVLHLTELLTQSGVPLPDSTETHATQVTYQDPCRLGRHLGIYDAPRQIIAGLGFDLFEMPRHASSSQCCGTSCWRSCGQVSKNIQVERLEEARATGAELLITACLKCQIHLKCAQNDPIRGERIDIQIRDLTTLVAEKITAAAQQAAAQEVSVGN
ncbi:MAG: (Fe-S)-binding protein [Chloroflexota bacterium]